MEETVDMDGSRATGYSIWMVPNAESELHTELARCIATLAEKQDTPHFTPHSTLIGGLVGKERSVIEKTQQLSEMLEPYEITLGALGSNGIYFQIFFSKIDETPQLMRSNRLAQDVFEFDSGIYFPHFSLAYGDFTPQQVQQLQDEVGKLNLSIAGSTFMVQELELWKTEGTVEDWVKLKRFPLLNKTNL
jgi:2'-5' RNA ligase